MARVSVSLRMVSVTACMSVRMARMKEDVVRTNSHERSIGPFIHMLYPFSHIIIPKVVTPFLKSLRVRCSARQS